MENYPEEELREAYPEFPYTSAGLSDELAFRDFIDWFILERIQPSTGKTIVREFAEKSTLSPEVRERIIQMENVKFGAGRLRHLVDLRGRLFLFLLLSWLRWPYFLWLTSCDDVVYLQDHCCGFCC